jgi:16S rRNA (guanine(1405)-N(7))-methyltransferase
VAGKAVPVARPPDPAAVFQQVAASAKYAGLNESFVRRIADEASARFRDQNSAVKYAKRKLHQAVGAFGAASPGDAVRACVAAIRSGVAVRDACLAAMRAHASTAERAAVLDPLYQQIETWCGRPSTVADLACGLSPLAIPWLAAGPDATYWCCDVDGALTAVLPDLSEPLGVTVLAETRDLVRPGALPAADLVLLLKTVSTLELQRTGAVRELLAALRAPHVVASLPRGSLSGRRRYTDDPLETMAKATAGAGYALVGEAVFGDEALYVLERDGP